MFDPYSKIAEVDISTQLKLCESLELRAADPEMRSIIDSYLTGIRVSPGMEILDVGCGTGAITRILAEKDGVERVVGIDPSSIFIKQAKMLNQHPHVTYIAGDGQAVPFGDHVFDTVVFHTVLCHVPFPVRFLEEAFRVLRKGGQLVIFDGDYAIRSVAIGEHDPLQACVEMMKKYNCQNPWLVRQLPLMLSSVGFNISSINSHGYLAKNPNYMINYLNRGAERMAEFGLISRLTAEALKEEANQRVTEGRFFGFIPFISFIAEAN